MSKCGKINKFLAILLTFGIMQSFHGVVFAGVVHKQPKFSSGLREVGGNSNEKGTVYMNFVVSADKLDAPDYATERYLIQDILGEKVEEILDFNNTTDNEQNANKPIVNRADIGEVKTTVTEKEEANSKITQMSREEKTNPKKASTAKLVGNTLVEKQYSLINILKEYFASMTPKEFGSQIEKSKAKWEAVRNQNNNDKFVVNWEKVDLGRLKELAATGIWSVERRQDDPAQNK